MGKKLNSIRNYFKPSSSSNVEAREPSLSAYEQLRKAKMQQNAAFLASLGIEKVATTKRKRKKPLVEKSTAAVVVRRRSRRLSHQPTVDETCPKQEDVESEYEDSSVLKYWCTTNTPENQHMISTTTASSHHQICGFRAESDRFIQLDPKLKRIYSIDFHPLQTNLFACGGHQGEVRLFGIDCGNEPLNSCDSLLMSFRAHRGWISAVSLALSRQSKNVLATSANDGSVKLWDINQSMQDKGKAVPKEIAACSDIHSSGIFSMDIVKDLVLTSSKDKTVCLSKVRGDSIQRLSTFNNHHDVVKCAEFRHSSGGDVFASCGNDKIINITDFRDSSSRSSIIIEGMHTKAINCVKWHPVDGNMLISSSFEPELRLFDIRKVGTAPLFTFVGHSNWNHKPIIYHPCWVDSGNAIVTNGTGSNFLSLYCAQTGKTISRGGIESSASYLHVHENPSSLNPLVVAQGSSIRFYGYKWQSSDKFKIQSTIDADSA